ncbi:MAG TPA: hypothetical protein VMH61_04315 [Candidatus Acidoferrales bacterium]|nr:hypothetical protein [Candidatus Acidoferrales bacterium]
MHDPHRRSDPPPPLQLHAHAEADLRWIRTAIERAGAFTSISGWGQVAVGVTALLAAALAPTDCTRDRWVAIWLGEALVAAAISVWSAAIKSQRLGVPLFGAPAQRFTLAFATPAAAGAVLTAALVRAHAHPLLAGTWLLLYGAAVASGGAFSVGSVPAMGACFMALGTAAALTPPAWANAWLALGFGLTHLGFGFWIARRHGG